MTNSIKKILFINFGGLGDEILFLPSVISVKKEFPSSEISLALEERSIGITQLTDIIDNTLIANIKGKNKYFELIKLLLKIWFKHYDIVISSGSNKFISIFLFLTFIKKRYGYDTGYLSRLLLTKAVKLNKNQYAVEMYHDLVNPVTENHTELPEFSIENLPTKENTVIVHPGVSKISVQKGMIKTISPEKWADVIKGLIKNNKKVILLGGRDDEECINKIVSLIPEGGYENLYGKTKSLKELAQIISSAEKFVCSDSAPLHIAVAMRVNTFVIFGSTDDKKLVPQNKDFVNVLKIQSKCPMQPCLWERRNNTCENLECLDIPIEYIVNSLL